MRYLWRCAVSVTVYFHFDDDAIIFDVFSCLEDFVGHKLGVPESQCTCVLDRFLKMFPGRIWNKALCNVSSQIIVNILVINGKRNWQNERPLQNVVVLSGENLDVHRQVFSLSCTISIQEHRCGHFVSISGCVEWLTDKFYTLVCRLQKFLLVVWDFPNEYTVSDMGEWV